MQKKAAARAADLLIRGGRIFTGNPRQPRAEAVAIRGNRIVAVGSTLGLSAMKGRTTRVIELEGRFACAGFIDCHVHLMEAGHSLTNADLSRCADREALVEKIRQTADALPADAWLVGRGWDQEKLAGQWPRREWLDEIVGDRPVLLRRVDGHTAWVSSAALSRSGIDAATPDPPGGRIDKDPDGRPTGLLRERAVELVESRIPEPGNDDRRRAATEALGVLRRLGITSVHDHSEPASLRRYRELKDEGRLTSRISHWSDLVADLGEAEHLREEFPSGDPMIRSDTLKVFVDGTLGSRTAGLMEPYADDPSTSGLMRWDEADLAAALRHAHHAGFQVALHAIGDRAVHVALSALDGLGGGGRARRHRIEHVEMISRGDVARFGATGAIASMQPVQLLTDLAWLDRRLGEERAKRAFAWRSLLDHKTPLIFGSDWPFDAVDPIATLRAAVAPIEDPRRPGETLRAEALLTVEEALIAMTRTAAWATFEETTKGTLEAGRVADIAILSRDPFSIPAEEIGTIEVEATVFDGRVVYMRGEEADAENVPSGESPGTSSFPTAAPRPSPKSAPPAAPASLAASAPVTSSAATTASATSAASATPAIPSISPSALPIESEPSEPATPSGGESADESADEPAKEADPRVDTPPAGD